MTNLDNQARARFIHGMEGIDPRMTKSVRGLASTSPEGFEWLADVIFKAPLYPQGTEEHVRQLNLSFTVDYLDHYNKHFGREVTGRSSSALELLYFYSRDFVGAVRSLHALQLAQEFPANAGGKPAFIHFLARDGLSESTSAEGFQAAGIPFPDHNYVPLSVRLMRQLDNPLLKRYLDQFHLRDPDFAHVLVDIGFTGEIPDLLSRMNPDIEYIPRFLISRAHPEIVKARPVMASAKGFLYDQQIDPNPDVFGKSDVVRALENTFGGVSSSATAIEEVDGVIQANTREYDETYDKGRREIALRGIKDATSIFITALQQGFTIPELLAAKVVYASNLKNIVRFALHDSLFVPHEATNLPA